MVLLERGPSLTDRAADEIRAQIVVGTLGLGEPLSEITLAAELGVSKTPVREALLQLKREGLVEVQPQRGTFVFAMTAEQVGKLSELRTILEAAALRLALGANREALVERWGEIVARMRAALEGADAKRYRTLDGEFHRCFFELTDNPYLVDAFNIIAFRVQALRNRLSLESELNVTSFREHEELLRLAEGGAVEETLVLLLRHIEWTREHYLAKLDGGPERSPPPKPRRRIAKR